MIVMAGMLLGLLKEALRVLPCSTFQDLIGFRNDVLIRFLNNLCSNKLLPKRNNADVSI